jgi:acetate kinase
LNTSQVILCVNGGSSSCKLALFRLGRGTEELLAAGAAQRIEQTDGRLSIRDGRGKILSESGPVLGKSPLTALLEEVDRLGLPRPGAAGHRIVHGGANHIAPERVTPALIADLKRLVPFAPLHLPAGIEGIEATAARYPALPQVACFDTAFHRRMPEIAERVAIPRDYWDEGVRRYGFHGISYEFIMRTLGAPPPSRVIIAHLGNGASMAAVLEGRPIDTTMGFTPAGGFMMGTRTGDLDPGVLLYLMKEKHYAADRLERLVNFESGLLGVSGLSADMKTLLEASRANPHAAQAIEMFCYQLRKSIGALAAALGGIDLLVFTGGIGERAAPIRAATCRGLEHLGIVLDEHSNAAHEDTISAADSRCAVRVIPTNENLMIARHAHQLIFRDQ